MDERKSSWEEKYENTRTDRMLSVDYDTFIGLETALETKNISLDRRNDAPSDRRTLYKYMTTTFER